MDMTYWDWIINKRMFDYLQPQRILKSGNRMIVFWKDGTKTIVKRAEDEPESDYNAFLACLGKKVYGSNSALKSIVKRVEIQEVKHGKE